MKGNIKISCYSPFKSAKSIYTQRADYWPRAADRCRQMSLYRAPDRCRQMGLLALFVVSGSSCMVMGTIPQGDRPHFLSASKVLYNIHCNENPTYVLYFWEERGLSPNFHIHVSVSDLYSPRIGLHISSSRIGRPIVGIYKSLTDAWMWKLGLRPRYSFSGNNCFEISVFCLCSVLYVICAKTFRFSLHKWKASATYVRPYEYILSWM